jgi:hypothetical protein
LEGHDDRAERDQFSRIHVQTPRAAHRTKRSGGCARRVLA